MAVRSALGFSTPTRVRVRHRGRYSTGLSRSDRDLLARVFRDRIFPVLTPLAVDPAHPFPYISHLSLNLAVMVRDPMRQESRFARVEVPALLPRYVGLPDRRLVPLEHVIAAYLPALFPGMEIVSHHYFRVLRTANRDRDEDEAGDLVAPVLAELRRKCRKDRAVGLEVGPDMSLDVLPLLLQKLELTPQDVRSVREMPHRATLSIVNQDRVWAL